MTAPRSHPLAEAPSFAADEIRCYGLLAGVRSRGRQHY